MAAIKGLFTNFLLCCLFFYPKRPIVTFLATFDHGGRYRAYAKTKQRPSYAFKIISPFEITMELFKFIRTLRKVSIVFSAPKVFVWRAGKRRWANNHTTFSKNFEVHCVIKRTLNVHSRLYLITHRQTHFTCARFLHVMCLTFCDNKTKKNSLTFCTWNFIGKKRASRPDCF